MREPSIEIKQQVLKEFLYHIRKDKKVDVEENKLFKLSFKFMKLTREQVLSIDSQVKEDIKESHEEGSFEVNKFFENLKEYHLSVVKDYLSWFKEYASLLGALEDFQVIFDIKNSKAKIKTKVNEPTDVTPSSTNIVDGAIKEPMIKTKIEQKVKIDQPSNQTSSTFYSQGMEELKENRYQTAIDCFQKGMDESDGRSFVEMAKLYEDCSSPNYKPESAFKMYSQLSEKGNGEATRNVAIMTMEGRGIGINSPKAVSILKKAIAQGDAESVKLLEDLLMTLTPEEIEKSTRY